MEQEVRKLIAENFPSAGVTIRTTDNYTDFRIQDTDSSLPADEFVRRFSVLEDAILERFEGALLSYE